MSNWSKFTAKRFSDKVRNEQEALHAQEAKQLAEATKAQLDAEKLRPNAPLMWDSLRELVETKCAEFNAEGAGVNFTFSRLDPATAEIILNTSPPKKMTLSFDERRYTITPRSLHGAATRKPISIQVKSGNGLGFFDSETGALLTVDRIAEVCLEELLGAN